VALLGRNGAGKSTTISLLLGLNEPDTGTVSLYGRDPARAVQAGLVGAMLQDGRPATRVTVRELVTFVARQYPAPMPVPEALRLAGIGDLAGRRVDKLSGGQTQRVRFAVALAGNPALIVLDEPTAALDVEARRAFWASMRAYTERGHTVLFSTHYLEEADANADRIVVIDHGRIVADGTGVQLKRAAGGNLVAFDLAGFPAEELIRLPGVPGSRHRAAGAHRCHAEDVSAPHSVQPRRPPVSRRMGTLLRFPAGMALVTWRYIWRVTALHRSETAGDDGDLPPRIPPGLADECSQFVTDGVGPMFHRWFSVRVEGGTVAPRELMDTLAADLNRAAPSAAAVFHKTVGPAGRAEVRDEYRVQMPGPWDGPVRVVHRDATSLRLATLRGHLEAGQIEFRATSDDGMLRFEIETWSRGGDRWADLLYSRLRMAKEMQLNMWVHFCLKAAAIAGGRVRGGVTVDTRAIPESLCAGAVGC
jgi:ABC-2 type transport system ATP-binding protein